MDDPRAWVAEHKVCWEIGPLREFVKGHGLEQTGYELTLFGRFDPAAQEDDDAAAVGVYEGLHALAMELIHAFPDSHSVIEVLPFDRAVHLRPEAGFASEVELTVVASPAHPSEALTAAEAQKRIAAAEDKLRSMGLHKKIWDRSEA